MAASRGRNWLLAVPLVVALVAVGVWAWNAGQGTTATTTAVATEAGTLQVVTAEDREPIPLDYDGPIAMTVYQSPTCGCCGLWVEHVEAHGFEVDAHLTPDMGTVKEGFAVPPQLTSCHTAVVEGYVIEGHVPAEDIRRLLAEIPVARGLAVPGMPVGSPGMEMGDRVDRYDVLLFGEAGETQVWSRQGT